MMIAAAAAASAWHAFAWSLESRQDKTEHDTDEEMMMKNREQRWTEEEEEEEGTTRPLPR